MRSSVVVMVIVAALVLAAGASPKGPEHASISGPGIEGSIRIEGDGDAEGAAATETPLGALVVYGGYASQVFGHHPTDPTTRVRPPGTLGPRYRAVYSVRTPTGRNSIAADLYPYATPHPVTYMKPGQSFYTLTTYGGWYVSPEALQRTLVRAGLPESPSAGGGATHVSAWLGIAALSIGAFAVAGTLLARRRPGSAPAPVP